MQAIYVLLSTLCGLGAVFLALLGMYASRPVHGFLAAATMCSLLWYCGRKADLAGVKN